jgi:predicted nucleotidyltransferase
MTIKTINFDDAKLQQFCESNHISQLSLFGSILRDDFREDSDIDVLVEFDPNARISLFDLGGIAMDLQQLLDREVDLRTPQDLSQYFRGEVQMNAKSLYSGEYN